MSCVKTMMDMVEDFYFGKRRASHKRLNSPIMKELS